MRNTKHTYTIEQLIEVVKESYSYAECLRKLDLPIHGGLYTTLKNRIKNYNIDISHFTGARWNKGKRTGPNPRTLTIDILDNKVEWSKSSDLRKRLIREGYFEEKCGECGLTEWRNVPIPLHLEHIDGNHFNNNLTNLKILCPNCHALTPTYGAKNVKLKRLKNNPEIIKKPREKKIKEKKDRPKSFIVSKEKLEAMVWEMPTSSVAKHFGVSDNAIGKRCKLLGINKPSRGYWAKKKASES